MIDKNQIKPMVKRLKEALESIDIKIKHQQAYEVLAKTLGFKNWSTMSGILDREEKRN